jgi:hypothetical protein
MLKPWKRTDLKTVIQETFQKEKELSLQLERVN